VNFSCPIVVWLWLLVALVCLVFFPVENQSKPPQWARPSAKRRDRVEIGVGFFLCDHIAWVWGLVAKNIFGRFWNLLHVSEGNSPPCSFND